MFRTPEIEIWNLTPGVEALAGPQRIFNVVGRLTAPECVAELTYSLNGSLEQPVFFSRTAGDCDRLSAVGDFNIDTINFDELKSQNRLSLRLVMRHAKTSEYEVVFPIRFWPEGPPKFHLNLEGCDFPEMVGQVVDGKWQISPDESGIPCLQIKEADAGYDRIILFGRCNWSTGYEIFSKLSLAAWCGKTDHGLGIGFKWNPHLQGDGTCLPSQWNTGIGLYYFPRSLTIKPGLRISIGVDVHVDSQGRYTGEYILKQGMLSFWRWALGNLQRHLFCRPYPIAQIATCRSYCFRLRILPEAYRFTIWPSESPEPAPQVVAHQPIDRHPEGAVGIIAHHCAVQVHEFEVVPVEPNAKKRSYRGPNNAAG